MSPKISLDRILEIAKSVYDLPMHTNLKQPLGNFRGDANASKALAHAIYAAYLQGYTYKEIGERMGGTPKGTISKRVADWNDRISSNNAILYKYDKENHARFLQAIQSLPPEEQEIEEEEEDYFVGEEEVSLPALDELAEVQTDELQQSVDNPVFEQVIKQKDKKITFGGGSWDDLGLNLPDDGVDAFEVPKTNTHAGGMQPPDAPIDLPIAEPSAQVAPSLSNTATFFVEMLGTVLPTLGGYFTNIDTGEIERLEETGDLPLGAVLRVEKQNTTNTKTLEQTVSTQLKSIKPSLARVTGGSGAVINPYLELFIAFAVACGMVLLTIYNIRSSNQLLVNDLKRKQKRASKGQEGDFLNDMRNMM